MPKRTAAEKIRKYKKKLRKLEQAQLEQSEDDIENQCEVTPDEMVHIEPEYEMEPETGPENLHPNIDKTLPDQPMSVMEEMAVTQSPAPPAATAQNTSDPIVPPTDGKDPPSPEVTTEVLDPEILSALGAATSDTPDFGSKIHDSLTKLWTPLLKKGLAKDEKEKLLKEYLVPNNCTLLQAPKLNPEISAAVNEASRGRDKKCLGFQQQLGTGISAINRAMDILLISDNKIQALKQLSDSCRILTDLHHSLTKDRIKLITPSLEKNFLQVIQDSERDETLFGSSLSEKIKASKAIERQGSQIRKSMTNHKTATPQTPANRPTLQGNWTGPPRYPFNRGGRGGQSYRGHRPALPASRRTYPPPTSTQAKGYNQSKTRAPQPAQ